MKLFLVALMTLMSLSAIAREDLSRENIIDLKDAKLLPKLRVYNSKKLVTYWKDTELTETGVNDGDVSTEIFEEKLKIIVGKHVRGLVTRVSDDFNSLYVSFDSDCKEASCSYFYELRDGVYDLSAVPARTGFTREAARAGVILRADPLKKQAIHLEFNSSELRKIIKKTDVADGHN